MNKTKAIAGIGAALLLSSSAMAGPSGKMMEPPMEPKDPWNYCDIFDLGKIYKSDTGFINKFAFIGRYQGQYHWSDSNVSDTSEDWENRRARFGVQIGFLQDFEFEGQFNLDVDGESRFFEDVEDLTIKWEPSDNFYVTVGKQKAAVTREWSTSSKKIKTFERSLFVNKVTPDKIGGVVVGFKPTDPLLVELGLYADTNTEDWGLPFDGDSDLAASLRVAYQVNKATEVRFDYLYADGAGQGGAADYENVFSLNSLSNWDRFHLVTDLIYATGSDDTHNSDGWSVVIMPYYDITDKLEAVFRYTYAGSDSSSGIRLQSRYERETAIDTRGDSYHAFYGGLNYYLCGDHLKLMGGIEYSTLDTATAGDYDQWTIFTGVRLYF